MPARGSQSRAELGMGTGLVWCCMAANTPGSRAEPGTYGHATGKQQQPQGIQRAKLSNALAQQLHGTHLGHPRTPFRALC